MFDDHAGVPGCALVRSNSSIQSSPFDWKCTAKRLSSGLKPHADFTGHVESACGVKVITGAPEAVVTVRSEGPPLGPPGVTINL
jgi:hypothetical protein